MAKFGVEDATMPFSQEEHGDEVWKLREWVHHDGLLTGSMVNNKLYPDCQNNYPCYLK